MKRKAKLGSIALLCVLSLVVLILSGGCATRSEIKRFQQQMDYLVKVNQYEYKKLAQIDSLLNEQQKLLRQLQATHDYDLARVQEELKTVENILRESGYKVSALTQQIKSMEQEIAKRQATPKTESETTKVTISARELFETGQLDFNRGKYQLAKMSFQQFLSLFPQSVLADDALYNLAECDYNLGRYRDAREGYIKLVQDYPESEFAPSALYKAGLASLKIDDVTSAKKYFQMLVKKYGHSHEAELAKEKLKKLRK